MANLNFSFPHPVYGNQDDISGKRINPVFKYSISDEQITLTANGLSLEDPDINKLVNSDQAAWQIRIQCPRTYLRLNFLCEGPDWNCHLNGTDFEGRVEIETRIIATSRVDGYQPKNAHSDYEGFEFTILAGELLAIGPSYTFLVDKLYDPLKAPVSSLLRVVEGSHEYGPYEVVLDDDLIFAKLSKKDWQEYPGVRDRLPTIVHSAIVLPVLARAIREMEQHSHTLWSNRLDNLIRAREIDPTDSLKAAQELLSSPMSRTFGEVNVYLDQQDVL